MGQWARAFARQVAEIHEDIARLAFWLNTVDDPSLPEDLTAAIATAGPGRDVALFWRPPRNEIAEPANEARRRCG